MCVFPMFIARAGHYGCKEKWYKCSVSVGWVGFSYKLRQVSLSPRVDYVGD